MIISIFEDDPIFLMLLRRFISERFKNSIIKIASKQEDVDILAKEKADFFFLDLNIDGLDYIYMRNISLEIRVNNPAAGIILMSAESDEFIKVDVKSSGSDLVISKEKLLNGFLSQIWRAK